MSYRLLNKSEITALQNQGCFSSDWSKIRVTDPFQAGSVYHTRFIGDIGLGKLGGSIMAGEGETRTSGLYNCTIENCEIGDNVLIDNVQLVKNYRIMDEVIIEHVHSVSVTGNSTFGNGFEIEVLNEGGGRELMLFDRLTAQLAYILVSYRHDPDLIATINRMIKDDASKKSSGTGTIGKGTRIINAGTISEVQIGEGAVIHGTTLLKNGTIASNSMAPVTVGEDVIAKNFIMLSGATVDGGALVDKCFVGQGVEIGKQFSAENSVFFANSEAFHGEAVSIFAGPYTVSHHKSSLLIAGMFSFYNAGSGTNQSNHMYKLGPVHQGILERGSKTGSFAYLLWPCRIGAFSVVMGKNLASFDTSDFPFSYINVDHEKSLLTPGMNLFTVGTRRDSEKWPKRDKRKDPVKFDLINFDFLSPYIVQKVIGSLDILQELYDKASKKQESVFYKGIRIKRLMLKSTRRYYQIALDVFVGNQLVRQLEKARSATSMSILRKELSGSGQPVPGKWIDMAGMIVPQQAVEDLLEKIRSGRIKRLEEISSSLENLHASYQEDAWDWTRGILHERFDIDINKVSREQLLELVNHWESVTVRLDKMILNDAAKEFDESSRIGFGIDGDAAVADKDFEAVRGVPDNNKFITGINEEITLTEKKAATLREMISRLKEQ
jgi:NDP-sugar pyrophosphorylase family protein